jgi:hypothetical protein
VHTGRHSLYFFVRRVSKAWKNNKYMNFVRFKDDLINGIL